MVVVAFAVAVAVGTGLLMLPLASAGPGHPGVVHAVFTSTSAVTVTGLASVGIAEWSWFGELVILVLVQVGGFGIMTIGATLVLLTARRVGLRHRMLTQAEVGSVSLGEMSQLVGAIARLTLAIEATVAAVVTLRLWATGVEPRFVDALYSGVFHAITAFNNAGVSIYPDNLMSFADDPVIVLALSVAIILGGLGFPIMIELRRRVSWRRWSLHTRLTLAATGGLLVVAPLLLLAFEWTNPATLGPMDAGAKLLSAWFQGVSPRTAGFNTIDIGAMTEPSLLLTIALMFIGAGPASTSGGIKVTTFALLAFVLWSELRGDTDVNALGRRIPAAVIRQAIAIVLLAIGVIVGTAMALLLLADVTALDALFEATSAFGTVGLSTGITPGLPALGQLLVAGLMFAGRVGPLTLATALVIRERRQAYRLAEERPILG